MLPFALQAVSGCATHADLALALAAELDETVVPEAAIAELDRLAATLAFARQLAPRAQLAACAEAAAARLAAAESRGGLDDLLLHRVLEERAGHPLLIAIATADAGRRADIPLSILGAPDALYVAHVALPEPVVLDPSTAALVDVAGREHALHWRCAHQTAGLLLDHVADRAEWTGQLSWALHCATLRLALPLGADAREQGERELARVRARFN